ncbi:hypothetical protein D1Z97_03260 [Riemerella anatipestifer]|uniref:hypothetical protein n=1 Tax=Riemerella anatipestifer TaxID=34085 RepID=UPI00129EE37A|nr:hypothetical protein [Riemerella anatipestifer]MRN00225.1 hypothetical protein [Riemerella anatipestifer]MRN02109.1 hypothetical protein [Riemerella anatipestifer]
MSNKTIDLGTFSWDTAKITEQIIENRTQIEQFSTSLSLNKQALNLNKKELQELGVKMAYVEKIQNKLDEELEQGTITQKHHTEQTKINNEAKKELTKRTQELNVEMAKSIPAIIENETQIKSLKRENSELEKILKSVKDTTEESITPYKALSDELDGLKLKSKNLGAQLVELKRSGKENTDEYRALEKQWRETSEQADNLNNELKSLDKAVGDNHRSVGDYKEQIKSAFAESTISAKLVVENIKKLDFSGAFDALKTGVQSGITSIRALSVAMMSNPITAILMAITAAATGVVLAFKEVWNYNEAQLPKMKLLQNKFGDLGADADELRIKINALEETFGLSFERIADTVDSVSSSGLGTELEAVDAIMKGIATTDNVDNFLSKLDLAASKARQTGMNLNEVLNLTKALQGTAIDPNTIYGGLEKATNRMQMGLNENKALVNAFGEAFSKDLLQQVQAGSITTVQALAKIQEQGDKNNISINKQAELGKELFGKAAANAGAYNEMMRLVGEAHKDQYADLTDLQKATIEYSEANVELAKAKDEALKSDSLIAFQEQWKIVWTKAKTLWYNFISFISKGLTMTEINLRALGKVFYTVFNTPKELIKALAKDFEDLANVASKMGEVIGKALTLDFGGAKKSFEDLKGIVSKGFKNTKASIGNISSDISSAYYDAFKQVTERNKGYVKGKEIREESEKKKENNTSGTEEIGTSKTKDAKRNKDDASKKIEAEAKKALELQKEASEQSIKQAQIELAEYIRVNSEKLKDEKRLTSEKLRLQNEYLKEVQKKQLAILAQEQQLKESVIQIKIDELNNKKTLNSNEKQELQNLKNELILIENEYSEQRGKLEQETQIKIKENNEKFEKQSKEDKKLANAIEFQQKILDLEEQNANEYEIKRAQADEQKENDLLQLEEDRANGLISLENYNAKKALIEKQHSQAIKDIDKEVQQAKIDGFANVFGQMKSVFGEQTALGKASAIAETVINTYKSATLAYSSLAGISVVGPALGAAAASLAVASGLKSVQKIMSVQTPKAQRGMFIEGKSHAQGGVPIITPNGMIEAEGGEIIINKISASIFKDLLSDINVAGGGVKFSRGGVVGGNIAGVQRSLTQKRDDVALVEAVKEGVYEGAIMGTHAGSQSGIVEAGSDSNLKGSSSF